MVGGSISGSPVALWCIRPSVSVHIFGGIMQAVYFVHVQRMRIKCFQSVIKFAVRAVNSSLVQPACRCEFHEIRVMSSQLHF